MSYSRARQRCKGPGADIAGRGFPIAVIARRTGTADAFMDEAGELAERIVNCGDRVADFIAAMTPPRRIILMVPAGPIVDRAIADYAPLLAAGDTIINAGNANFHGTRRRTGALREQGIHFIGMGVSGGEHGARTGPSMMIGGDPAAFAPIRGMIEAIAAKFGGDPCAAHVGPDGAGHFVKTVHNGIEYADMQLLAEVRGLMRDGMGRSPAALGGTGSAELSEDDAEAAMLAGRILAHAQGFEVMQAASDEYGWGIDMARVAEIWRAGSIIRSALPDDISAACRAGLPHGRLWLAPRFADARHVGGACMVRHHAPGAGRHRPDSGAAGFLWELYTKEPPEARQAILSALLVLMGKETASPDGDHSFVSKTALTVPSRTIR